MSNAAIAITAVVIILLVFFCAVQYYMLCPDPQPTGTASEPPEARD